MAITIIRTIRTTDKCSESLWWESPLCFEPQAVVYEKLKPQIERLLSEGINKFINIDTNK
jgi:hypothetical protein